MSLRTVGLATLSIAAIVAASVISPVVHAQMPPISPAAGICPASAPRGAGGGPGGAAAAGAGRGAAAPGRGAAGAGGAPAAPAPVPTPAFPGPVFDQSMPPGENYEVA